MAEKKSDQANLQAKALAICEDARAQLVLRHPFVGRLGIQIPFVPVNDSRIHTIASNGKVIYIRPEWVCRMPKVTMTAFVAHTIWTAALCHAFRRGDFDKRKFDLASDIEVYSLLCLENVPKALAPEFCDLFPRHLPVEEIVGKLPDNKFVRTPNMDVHLYSAGIVALPGKMPAGSNMKEKEEEKESPSEKNSSAQEKEEEKEKMGEDPAPEAASSQEGTEEEPSPSSSGAEGSESSGEDHESHEADCQCDPSMREIWRQRIIEAGQHYKMVYGHLPGELEELVNFFAEGKTNRIQILRRYLSLCKGGESHWLPPARRFVWQGQYLPSREDPKLEFAVAVDTSGSIGKEDFIRFMGEVVNTLNGFSSYELTLIMCDAAVCDVKVFTNFTPFRKDTPLTVKGGGGTDFRPVFEYIREKRKNPRVLLYYTDGEGRFPEKAPPYPVLWILTQEGQVPWGRKIVMEK